MEAPADVRAPRRAFPDWLREALFILASIALAFAVDEFREYRANKALAARVLTSVEAELNHNLAEVEPFLDIHRRWAEALAQPNAFKTGQSGLDAWFAARPALPAGAIAEFPTQVRSAAWDAAVSSGALRLIDYELVAALSEIYDAQEFYGETINRSVSLVTAVPTFDPSATPLSVRQLALTLQSVAFAEQLLIDRYRQHLPTVRAAAHGDR